MCYIKMQELLENWFNERAVVARCCSEDNTFIMSWNWFDERAVFDNSALMNVLHYTCEWKVCSRIDLMNEQCLTTQHWWMCHICMWMKGLLENWFNEWAVFDNSALMNVSQYACRWKVCSGIGLMNRQCLTTQLCECAVILIQMKEPLKNWSDERTVLKIKELCLTT